MSSKLTRDALVAISQWVDAGGANELGNYLARLLHQLAQWHPARRPPRRAAPAQLMRRKQLAVIVDVDGTLCDVRGVRHYILGDPLRRDFRAFHAASSLCPPHGHVVDMVREYADAGIVVHVVTARMNEWRFVTGMWLRKWEVPFDRLWMRRDGDGRSDREVKLEILRRIQQDHEVIVAIDDNPSVLELWHDELIPTITVPGWYEVVS